MTANKLKQRDIAPLREQLLVEQEHVCLLCQEVIEQNKAVLDHDHKSGHIRGVLHRGCNSLLGKIENNLARNLITPSRLSQILKNLERYSQTQRPEIHPTYKPPKQKKAKSIDTKP